MRFLFAITRKRYKTDQYFNLDSEKDLKIVEVPITFKKRTGGASKSGAERKSKGLLYGLKFIWFVLKA